MRLRAPIFLIVAILLAAGCQEGPEREPSIGEAFVGPLNLKLRSELAVRAEVAATVNHGDRVEILRTRRRFVRVRAPNGAEGWTDDRNLLSATQMGGLRTLADRSAKLPSQGSATVYSALNVHTEPNRGAPSFHQIPEGGHVEVLAYRVEPRVPFQQPPLVRSIEPPSPRRKPKVKRAKEPEIAPPPKPAPPGLPPDWLELSRSAMPEEEDETGETSLDEPKEAPPTPKVPEKAKKPENPENPVPAPRRDDWCLVRTPEGKAGWVLTRALIMAIPDEVAQYAEGHRITSYFSLGEVRDGEQFKHNWLWTTLSSTLQPYQFDGFRVFSWNLRRHRYETTYIERRIIGYLPAAAHPVKVLIGGKEVTMPGFSLVTEDKTGQVFRRTFVYEGYRVRTIGREPAEKRVISGTLPLPGEPLSQGGPAPPEGAFERVKRGIGGLFRR